MDRPRRESRQQNGITVRVFEQDMLSFKDARLKVATAKTLKDGDLPGIKSVFGWTVDNRKLIKNPADAVKVKSGKILTRSKGFTDKEAKVIFEACVAYGKSPKEDSRTAAAKRWAPPIAAYTGCRISEALQLRKEDVREESGHHVFRSQSTSRQHQIRNVSADFLSVVRNSDDGPLFAKGSYKRVLHFIRTIVTDERVQPNHAWRHRLKTISRNLGFDPRVVDAIQVTRHERLARTMAMCQWSPWLS
jgi:integrase